MWREQDPRESERDRADLSRGSRARAGQDDNASRSGARDAFTRNLELPSGSARERVRVRSRSYDLRGSEVRTLATVGAFRAVPVTDLRDASPDRPVRRDREVIRLRELGLVRTMPYVVGQTRTTVVTLTDRGRAVLESARSEGDGQRAQSFHAGILKPRELAHDVRLYAAYLKSAEGLISRGGQVRRVVLEEDLKRDYQRFLQESNRGRRDSSGRPDRDREEIERWARERALPFDEGHVQFPDVRIEYDDRDGRARVEDVEVTTPNYRGAHALGKVRAGFTRYRAAGARLAGSGSGRRGGRGLDPRLAEQVLE